jgi:hypothetical protein
VAGTSCNCGCTLSCCASARSRPSAESFANVLSALSPPQAANAAKAANASDDLMTVERNERVY